MTDRKEKFTPGPWRAGRGPSSDFVAAAGRDETLAAWPRSDENAAKLLRGSGFMQEIFCYALVKDVEDAESRCRTLRQWGIVPFAQPYRDFTSNSELSEDQKRFARFVNIKGGKMLLKMKFKDYYSGRETI